MAGKEPEGQEAFEPEPLKMLSDLESIRLLSDPLRLRILDALCEQERTTKQVAEQIGEKPTKLYHHVDTLEKAGLIRMTRTRQVRGTLEKYYRVVARMFRADPTAFMTGDAPDPETISTLQQTVGALTQMMTQELSALVTADLSPQTLEDEGLISFVEIRASESFVLNLRKRLYDLLQELTQEDSEADDDSSEPERRFRLVLALYPLDR